MSSGIASVSDVEEALRKRLLGALQQYMTAPNKVPAKAFQAVMGQFGIRFGDPRADRIMLLCNISEEGIVDTTRFAEVVELSDGNVELQSGGVMSPRLHSDLHELSQADRVKRLAKDIHQLFFRFDTGQGTLDEFRRSLAALGIRETNETQRLLRQTPISFRELLHSLTQTQSKSISGDIAAGVHKTSESSNIIFTNSVGPQVFHRGHGKYKNDAYHDSDVITWSMRQNADDVDTGPGGKSTGIFSGGDASRANHVRAGVSTKMYKGGGVASVLGKGGSVSFETTTQMAAQDGIGQHNAVPPTSAGYHTKDAGLVREQIYSTIRQLDSGLLTASMFRTRLASMGMSMPPEADRLLYQYQSHGRVGFRDFVRAFEDYFAVVTTPAPPMPPLPPSNPVGSVKVPPAAGQNHGDIITWSAAKGPGKDSWADPRAHHNNQAFEKRIGNITGTTADMLKWHGPKDGILDPARRARGAGTPHKGPEGDIITWKGAGPPVPRKPTHKGETAIGFQERSKACPYGTDSDLAPGQIRTEIRGMSRKAMVGSKSQTGSWFGPGQSDAGGDPATHAGRRYISAQARDDHLSAGMTVNAAEIQSGKKRFVQEYKNDHFISSGDVAEAAGPAHNKSHYGAEYAPDQTGLM